MANGKLITAFIDGEYKPALKKLLVYLGGGTIPAEEGRGYFSRLSEKMNKILQAFGESISSQYTSDWYSGRTVKKGGLDLGSVIRLGLCLEVTEEPGEALALGYLALAGAWNPQTHGPEYAIAALRVARGEVPLTLLTDERLSRIDLKVNQIYDVLVVADNKPEEEDMIHPLTAYFLEVADKAGADVEKLKATAADLFETEPAVLTQITNIFDGIEKPLRSSWMGLSQVLVLTTRDAWTPKRIEAEAERLQVLQEASQLSNRAALESVGALEPK